MSLKKVNFKTSNRKFTPLLPWATQGLYKSPPTPRAITDNSQSTACPFRDSSLPFYNNMALDLDLENGIPETHAHLSQHLPVAHLPFPCQL